MEKIKKTAAILIIAASAALFLHASGTGIFARKDFISYWAAGQLLLHHQNPYDDAAVFRLERSAGYAEPQPLVMRNPPYGLFLALPLGLLSLRVGGMLWAALILFCIIISIRTLWAMHGKPADPVHLFGYIFAPTASCMVLGQTSPIVLLGIVGFLRWHRERPLLAGLCTVLLAIKFQLLLPFGLILLIWVLTSQATRLLLGSAIGLVSATLLPLYFDHSVIKDYIPTLRTANADSYRMPTMNTLFRFLISPQNAWLQLLPLVLALVWAIWYFLKHRNEWNWNRHGLALLVVSVWVAPYSWFFDQVVVLPAIQSANYALAQRKKSLNGFLILNAVALFMVIFQVPYASTAYVWTASAWVGWYLFAMYLANKPEISTSPAEAPHHI